MKLRYDDNGNTVDMHVEYEFMKAGDGNYHPTYTRVVLSIADEPVAVGEALLHPNDWGKFNRVTGRKLAFQRAVEAFVSVIDNPVEAYKMKSKLWADFTSRVRVR